MKMKQIQFNKPITFQSAVFNLLENEYKLLAPKQVLELLSKDISKLHEEFYPTANKEKVRELLITTNIHSSRINSKEKERVTVILPLVTKNDSGKRTFQQSKNENIEAQDLKILEILLNEARSNGNILSGYELGRLMNRSISTIRRYLDIYTEKNGGEVLPLKGYIIDEKSFLKKTNKIVSSTKQENRKFNEPIVKTTSVIEPTYNNKRQNRSFEDLTCLYIDNELGEQILFRTQMKELKKIVIANSFEQAIPLLNSNKFDLIITDINLPGQFNGIDVMHAIKQTPKYEATPVIAVTSYVLPGDRERFIKAGFNAFIHKPVTRNKLKLVVKNLI